MKQHDLEPPLVMFVSDDTQTADLRGVSSWRIVGKQRGVLVVDGAPTVTIDPATPWKATLTRAWQAGETAKTGPIELEAEATWPTGRPQTFPGTGHLTLNIEADLG